MARKSSVPFALTAYVASAVMFVGCAHSKSDGLPEPSGLVLQGETALSERRYEEASALFAAAVTDRETAFLGWIGLARVAAVRREARALEGATTQAMATDPLTPASRDLIGRTMLEAARAFTPPDRRYLTVAFGYFRRAAESDPDLPHLRYHAGLAADLLGNTEFAAEAFEAAHAVEPDARDPLRALLNLRRKQGDRESMRRLLDGLAARRQGLLPPEYADDRRFADGGTTSAPATSR